MYKVVIIDDEDIIRQGLVTVINWNSLRCQVVGQAADGVEGRTLIEEEKPHIIITDIKMPHMDGLEMVRNTRELLGDTKIILLTGYRNMDYLQEAIRVGAFDYLLKPSNIKDIHDVIKRAVSHLDKEHLALTKMAHMEKQLEEYLPVVKEKLIHNLIHHSHIQDEGIAQQLQKYGIVLDGYYVVLWRFKTVENFHLLKNGIHNIIDTTLQDIKMIMNGIEYDHNSFVTIISSENLDAGGGQLYTKIREVQHLIKKCFDITVAVGVSTEASHYRELHQKILECDESIDFQFCSGKSDVLFYHDIKAFKMKEYAHIFDGDIGRIIQDIRGGDKVAITDDFQSFKSKIQQHSYIKEEDVKKIYWELIEQLYKIRTHIKEEKEEEVLPIIGLYNMVNRCVSLVELHGLVEDFAMTITNQLKSLHTDGNNSIQNKAISYVQDHYRDNISLKDVARHVHASVPYVSRLFTRSGGQSFVELLNDLRINEAKRMLIETQLHAYEIGEQVGINNPHYFSRLFKRCTGQSPSDYRKNN